MRKAIIHTRHALTPQQLNEMADRLAGDDHEIINGMHWASRSIQSKEQALDQARAIIDSVNPARIATVQIELWGVVPVPLRWAFDQICGSGLAEYDGSVWVYESFNINRSLEGQKPTFEHNGWLLTQVWNE